MSTILYLWNHNFITSKKLHNIFFLPLKFHENWERKTILGRQKRIFPLISLYLHVNKKITNNDNNDPTNDK